MNKSKKMQKKKEKSTKANAKTQRKDIADEEDVIVSGSEDAVLTMTKNVPDKNAPSSDSEDDDDSSSSSDDGSDSKDENDEEETNSKGNEENVENSTALLNGLSIFQKACESSEQFRHEYVQDFLNQVNNGDSEERNVKLQTICFLLHSLGFSEQEININDGRNS